MPASASESAGGVDHRELAAQEGRLGPAARGRSTADDDDRLLAAELAAANLHADAAVRENKRRYASVHVQQVQDILAGHAVAYRLTTIFTFDRCWARLRDALAALVRTGAEARR